MLKKPKCIKPLAMYHPSLLGISIALKVTQKKLQMLLNGKKYATKKDIKPLKFRVKSHKSLLLRKLGSCDMYLQYNKIKNLELVIKALNGIIIEPNETFSYFKLLGKPTKKRGFKKGIQLSGGKVISATAGGICQSSNLIYWLVLHSPLEVVERHHHSFDPFPDEGRVLPFASGATVMYNYLDLQIYNPTEYKMQLLLKLDETFLYGELRTNKELKLSYKVIEKNHYFEKIDNTYYRSNELYKKVIDKRTGNYLREEFIVRNYSKVKYIPTKQKLEATSSIKV